MKILATATNYWDCHVVFIHKRLEELQRPTPFMTRDIHGREIMSRIIFTPIPELEQMVTLKQGDYVMLILDKDIKKDPESYCGHMHYFDGKNLVSVYNRRKYKGPRLDMSHTDTPIK